ncbi:MAG: trehalose-6-phosphate synthase [Chloroflexi bacterium]|nr:trehalose-6-phosphate synthase [Chloroflexota bacterium]
MRTNLNLANPSLVVVSNRGPVEHHFGRGNEIETKRASGGLVTALTAFRRRHEFTWIAGAVTPGDRYVAGFPKAACSKYPPLRRQSVGLVTDTATTSGQGADLVVVPQDVFHNYYDIFCNRFLWFLQHSIWDQLQAPKGKDTITEAWRRGYVPTNLAFAEAVAARVGRQRAPVIMLQDFHLYLAPGLIRQQVPEAILQQFVHIPWPGPEGWRHLPLSVCGEIYRSSLANDVIGFQTSRSAHNFLRCCEAFLPDAEVDYVGKAVSFRNRILHVRVYPISVDVGQLRDAMNSSSVWRYQDRLRPIRGEQTVVRVDRLCPAKNIARGFRAFQQLLDTHKELQGNVRFLAFLVPSRTAIKEYAAYRDEVMSLVQAINAKFGRDGFRPIDVFYENDYHQALAGMSLSDVLLVNPVADGMNLVAKEGPIVSTRDSVLVLSKAAGAFDQLCEGVLSVEPDDIDGTAGALATALAMSREERRERVRVLRARIEKEDLAYWIRSQLKDIGEIYDERKKGQQLRHVSNGQLSSARGSTHA